MATSKGKCRPCFDFFTTLASYLIECMYEFTQVVANNVSRNQSASNPFCRSARSPSTERQQGRKDRRATISSCSHECNTGRSSRQKTITKVIIYQKYHFAAINQVPRSLPPLKRRNSPCIQSFCQRRIERLMSRHL